MGRQERKIRKERYGKPLKPKRVVEPKKRSFGIMADEPKKLKTALKINNEIQSRRKKMKIPLFGTHRSVKNSTSEEKEKKKVQTSTLCQNILNKKREKKQVQKEEDENNIKKNDFKDKGFIYTHNRKKRIKINDNGSDQEEVNNPPLLTRISLRPRKYPLVKKNLVHKLTKNLSQNIPFTVKRYKSNPTTLYFNDK